MATQLVVLMPLWIRLSKQRPALLMQPETALPRCRMQQHQRQTPAPRPCQVCDQMSAGHNTVPCHPVFVKLITPRHRLMWLNFRV